MTFISVAWTNGDTITEVKLDQMIANDGHVREEADYKILIAGNITRTDTSEQDSNVSVSIDATAIATYTTSGAKSLIDYDISGFTNDIHTLVFDLDGNTQTFRFVKTPDMTRLSMWMNVVSSINAPYTVGASECTIIAHLGANSWT